MLACWSKKSFLIEGTRVLRLPSDIQLVVVGDFPGQRAIKYVEHLAYAMVRKKLPVNFNVRKRRNFCISRNVLEKVGKAGLMSL